MRKKEATFAAIAIVAFVISCRDAAAPGPVRTAAAAAPATAKANTFGAAVDSLFSDAEKHDRFSGSVVVIDGGREVLAKGYGFADRKVGRRNDADTVFRIGSVSKQFAATAILTLVRDGKIALTDPVSKFFPEYPKENLTMDGALVTLHHLISHTSGLPNPRSTSAFEAIVWKRPIAPTEQIGFAKATPLASRPGSKYQYVNFNFLLAALVVERVSGQPYEAFLKKRFFEPLDMKDTGTVLPPSLQPRSALGYHDDGGELVTMMDDAAFKDRDVTFAFGSGQIHSTVHDLARWDRALVGEAVLPAAQRDLLFKRNLDDYGYGWVVNEKDGVTYAWHNGAISPLGFSTLIVRVPSKDRFVAYASNFDMDLTSGFESQVFALAVK